METAGKPKIVIGCDHAAYDFKQEIKEHCESLGYEVNDVGCNSATEKVG
jgi:ribose 5-phosphate isomerase B